MVKPIITFYFSLCCVVTSQYSVVPSRKSQVTSERKHLHSNNNNTNMTGKSLPTMATPLRVRRPDIIDEYDDDVEEEEQLNIQNPTSSRGNKLLQIVSLPSPFRLPDDWLVEERPRPSKPSHKDKYYYEPGTGRQFRSLVSVRRYLTEGTTDFHSRATERRISENENTMKVVTHTRERTSFIKLPNDWIVKKKPRKSNYAGVTDRTNIEPGTGQRSRSLRAVERYLTGESAYTATTKSVVKSGTGKLSALGVKSCLKTVQKHSSVAEEDKITLKAMKHSKKSTESDSPKKINSGKDNRASMHNLSKPPAKVNWVLSGPGGYWSPFVDDSIVPDFEKLKWSEAFVLSIHDGVIN